MLWQARPGFIISRGALDAPAIASTATWNPSDKSTANIVLSSGNLTATVTAGNIGGAAVRSTLSHTSGKYYIEYTTGSIPNTSDTTCMGITTGAHSLTTIGSTNGGSSLIVFSDTTTFFNGSSQSLSFGGGIGGAVWGWAIDLDNQRAWIRKGAGSWNASGLNNPSTNVGGLDISAVFGSNAAFPVWSPQNNSVLTANFGASGFTNSAPSGFSIWG